MRKGAVIVGMVLLLCGATAAAEELVFPKAEQEIVRALSLKDGTIIYKGVEYVSEGGRVYRIVNGEREPLKNLSELADSELMPKAGALIHFDYDSATIKPESHPLLNEFGAALNGGLAEATVIIAGHTDSRGTEEYNERLSEKRANAVRDYLITHHGIDPYRLMPRGYGERQPIRSNETKEGRALNRRVEFVLYEIGIFDAREGG